MPQTHQLQRMTHPVQWTADSIYSLVPDESSRRLSRRMAGPEKWLTLGAESGLIWGEFPIKSKPSVCTSIRLAEPIINCTCGGRRSPCEHAISLLLLWAEAPEAFQSIEAPDWACGLPDSSLPTDRTSSSDANGRQSGTRQAALLRGLEELELWLHDLARSGLADAQQRSKASWGQVAERLIDAGASELAREVRRIADIPASGLDWPERLMGRLGLLYLLIQGFKRMDSLPLESQADLRMAVGWLPRSEPSRPDLCLRDRWHVLSNQFDLEGRQRVQRTWLWGEDHDCAALIVQRSYRMVTVDARLMTGTVLDADVCYFATSTPIRARVGTVYERSHADAALSGCLSIEQAIAAYSQAISRNPWIGAFPLLLHGVTAVPDGAGWTLIDHSGALPLPSNYTHLWHLRALTRHGDAPVFGEWDGEMLRPLSIRASGRWIALRGGQGAK